jgi:hypothetical protein
MFHVEHKSKSLLKMFHVEHFIALTKQAEQKYPLEKHREFEMPALLCPA